MRKVGWHAGGGDGSACFDRRSDRAVEVEELREQILFCAEAIGGQHRGVERGVGIFERVLAREFERAVDGAEAALHFREGTFADAADFAADRRRRSPRSESPSNRKPVIYGFAT